MCGNNRLRDRESEAVSFAVAGAIAVALALGALAGLYPAVRAAGPARRRRCAACESI
jgi:hypothetical protein